MSLMENCSFDYLMDQHYRANASLILTQQKLSSYSNLKARNDRQNHDRR